MKPSTFLCNLNALQKGMILVLVPVLLEFIVLAFLGNALRDADKQLTQIENSRNAILKLQKLETSLEVTAIDASDEKAPPAVQVATIKNIKKLIQSDSLSGLSEHSNPELKDVLRTWKTIVGPSGPAGLRVRRIVEDGVNPKLAIQGTSKFEIINSLMQLRRFFHQIVRTEYQVRGSEPAKLRKVRALIIFWLLMAVLLSLGVSSLLAWFFTDDITNRLKRIANSASALSSDLPLPPPQEGSDEIAQLEQVLFESASKVRELQKEEFAILDNAADIICSLDEQLHFAETSAAVTRAWSYSRQELIGKSIEVILSEDIQNTADSFRKIKNETLSGTIENRVCCGTKSIRNCLWKVHWSASERKFFCVVHDITELRAIEELKHQFLQLVCHDLRNPLLSIAIDMDMVTGATSETILETQASEQSLFANISTSLEKLNSLVNELLELEQLESGKIKLTPTLLSASDLCLLATESLAALAKTKHIEVEQPESDALLRGDEYRLIQAVKKLLFNALTVSPPDSKVKLVVSTKEKLVRITAIDQGPAITDAEIGLVFEKFRLSTREKSLGKNLGLGLVIASRIATAHGGQAGVASDPAQGSQLWLELPVYEITAADLEDS